MVKMRILKRHIVEPLCHILVVLLIDNNHLVLAFITNGKQIGKHLPELWLLLLTSDNDADVIQVES